MPTAFVRLRDPAHVLPFPGQPHRHLKPEGEIVDIGDPFWVVALADGSVELVPEAAQATASPSIQAAAVEALPIAAQE